MKGDLYILFNESSLQPNNVDEDYEDQYFSAIENGFKTLIFNYDNLVMGNPSFAKRIKPIEEQALVVYRGWMLTPAEYTALYEELLSKNYQLINTPKEYRNCHYLPDSLPFIEARTPKTVFQQFVDENSLQDFIKQTKAFGNKPIILKDYVKSEKHHWGTACYVADVSDVVKLEETANNLLELRGKHLNEGLVAREFVELKELVVHSKSGMPLTEEYRLFFCNQQLVGIYDYWEEGDYNSSLPDVSEFLPIAELVESKFFSMDIAKLKNGELIIVELGDGQVAGLPDKTDRKDFYRRLKICLS